MRELLRIRLGIVVCCLLVVPSTATALDEIYSPNVEYHEISLEYNGDRTFDTNPQKNNIEGDELAIEVGATPRWEVEGSAIFEKNPDQTFRIADLELENRFQFAEQGENWLDSGLLVAYDHAIHAGDSDNLEIKLLLQKDFGKISNIANIGFDQAIGVNASGGPDFVFLWNTRYRYSEYFQPGIEIQNDLGQDSELRHWSEQQDYIGPAVWGRVYGHLKYQVGFFAGVSDAASKTAGRVLFEYETHF